MRYLNYILPMLLSLQVAALSAQAPKDHLINRPTKKTSAKAQQCPTRDTITRICADSIGKHGYVINEPGTYALTEDVVYNPNANRNPAIFIKSDNVTLLLQGKTLSQIDKSKKDVIGIRIAEGLNNIEIKNGTIRGF